MKEKLRYIGKGFPIHDAYGKVTGSIKYAGDMTFGKTLYMVLLVSSKPHAVVISIDCSEAEKTDGVIGVFHCFNTTPKKFSRYKRAATIDVPEQEQIFTDHVRYVGDRIGAVVADDPVTARDATKKITIEYEELPFAENVEAALSGIIDDMHDEGVVYGYSEMVTGNKQEETSDCVRVSTHTHLDRVSHVAMEPHAYAASYDKTNGEMTIWSPNQSVYGMRYVVANFLGLPLNKVRVIKTTMGGSFGGKQECVFEPVIAAIAIQLNNPVVLVVDRTGSMVSSLCRAPMDADICAVFGQDQRIKELDITATFDAGAYLGSTYTYAKTLGEMALRNYEIPYFHYSGRAVCTNMPVSGGFRGWSTPEVTIIIEHCFDETAKILNVDPVELRIKNAVRPGDIDPAFNVPFEETRLIQCLESGREKFFWTERRKKAHLLCDERYKIGVGMACCGHLNGNYPGSPDFSLVEMRINEDGTVDVNVTLHDHGCGTVRVMQIIAGEMLGIDPLKINIKEGDTAITPFDVGCYTSRTTHVIGAAVEKCAEQLIEEVLRNTAIILETDFNDLVYSEGTVSSRSDFSMKLTLQEIAKTLLYKQQKAIAVNIQHRSSSNPGVHGAHFVQLAVDTYTGLVSIQNYLAVHDIGKALNPDLCIGQIQGAVQMGAGIALSETMNTKRSGCGKTVQSMKDYHIMNAGNIPHVDVMFIEDGGKHGPYGAKSIGEISFAPVSAAIVSAVNHALDTNWNSIPLTPDRILSWLKGKDHS